MFILMKKLINKPVKLKSDKQYLKTFKFKIIKDHIKNFNQFFIYKIKFNT